MKYIARTLALALLGIGLSQAAENPAPAPKIPLEARVKEATKPYSWNQIDFMSVPEGKEDAYEAVERDWKKIHDELARRGKMISWTLWKAEDPAKAGFDYATVKTFDCVADALNVYDWDEIAEFYGKDKLQELFNRTGPDAGAKRVVGGRGLHRRRVRQGEPAEGLRFVDESKGRKAAGI